MKPVGASPDPAGERIAAWIEMVRDRLPIHPHLAFESLAYLIGFLVYRLQRQRQGDFLDDDRRWSLFVAVVLFILACLKRERAELSQSEES